MTEEKTCSDVESTLQDVKDAQKARIGGTAIVAIGVVVLLVIAAALVFFGIAALMRSDWMLLALIVVGVVVLLALLNRLMRVAANQNKIEKL